MAGQVEIIIGVPGAGKTVQADRLESKRGYVHLSTGALLRAFASDEVKTIMSKGKLAPQAVVEQALGQAIETVPPNLPILIDGSPRTKSEQDWLGDKLKQIGRQIGRVIYLNVDKAIATQRLATRGRTDDSTEVIDERWKAFEHDTSKVVERYKKSGQLVEVDANGTPDEVASRIEAAL